MKRSHAILTAGLFAVLNSQTTAAQMLRARVVDQSTRQPIASAWVVVVAGSDTVAVGESGKDGFVAVSVHVIGSVAVIASHAAYVTQTRSLHYDGSDITVPAFVLQNSVFELDSIAVETEQGRADLLEASFVRASHIVAGEQLKRIEQFGGNVVSVAREIPGLRVREWVEDGRPRTCIESIRRMPQFQLRASGPTSPNRADRKCPQPVVLIMDGIVVGDIEQSIRGIDLETLESVVYLTPVEAGSAYGMDAASVGAIVLWSRGLGPIKGNGRQHP